MQKLSKVIAFIRRQPRWRLAVGAGVAVILALLLFSSGGSSAGNTPTFTARRGPLDINILEGGSLQALESQEIKCEVRVGYQGTKILKIVEEGSLVTEDDVKTNKILVELDSSELQKQIVQQEIAYQSALASLTDGQQNFEIQLSQNESDIKSAQQKARFARMDFDKFLGDSVTETIVAQVGLDKLLAMATTNHLEQTVDEQKPVGEKPSPKAAPGDKPPVTKPAAMAEPAVIRVVNTSPNLPEKLSTAASPPEPEPAREETASATILNSAPIDFTKYANIEVLGDGEAKQKLRKFEDDLQVAQKELGQAKSTIEGTRRLFDKGFVTKNDLQRDEIAYDNNRLKVQTAETARDLYLKYEFPKAAEESLSKFAEAVRDLDKAHRQALSKLAQAKARLRSAEGQYQVQLRQRKDLNEQLEKCTLRALKPGLVVYGSGRGDMEYYGGEERVREGASVRERQAIITIPNLTRMSVNVKIHESYIKKVKKGLKARITVDAFPDETLTGEISKVGVLPDSQNRWMSPDLKVYLTTITIDGTHDWVKPGMSAKVEILVNHLSDVIYVPVQAVVPFDGKHVCYVARGFKSERREVGIGEMNEEFIEIKSGLKEGERVLLRQPAGTETDGISREKKKNEKEKPAAPAAPATPSAETAKS